MRNFIIAVIMGVAMDGSVTSLSITPEQRDRIIVRVTEHNDPYINRTTGNRFEIYNLLETSND